MGMDKGNDTEGKMCGFFAIVFDKENKEMGKILTKAGRRLSYRGYDTSGAVVLDAKGKFDP